MKGDSDGGDTVTMVEGAVILIDDGWWMIAEDGV